jgi:hypothetical protein
MTDVAPVDTVLLHEFESGLANDVPATAATSGTDNTNWIAGLVTRHSFVSCLSNDTQTCVYHSYNFLSFAVLHESGRTCVA